MKSEEFLFDRFITFAVAKRAKILCRSASVCVRSAAYSRGTPH